MSFTNRDANLAALKKRGTQIANDFLAWCREWESLEPSTPGTGVTGIIAEVGAIKALPSVLLHYGEKPAANAKPADDGMVVLVRLRHISGFPGIPSQLCSGNAGEVFAIEKRYADLLLNASAPDLSKPNVVSGGTVEYAAGELLHLARFATPKEAATGKVDAPVEIPAVAA